MCLGVEGRCARVWRAGVPGFGGQVCQGVEGRVCWRRLGRRGAVDAHRLACSQHSSTQQHASMLWSLSPPLNCTLLLVSLQPNSDRFRVRVNKIEVTGWVNKMEVRGLGSTR